MKKNNKGFVVSAVLYPLLVLFLALIMGLISMSDTRKRILDKMKLEISESIFDEATCSCETILNRLEFIIRNGVSGGGGGGGSYTYNVLGLNVKKYGLPAELPNTGNGIGDIAMITPSVGDATYEEFSYWVASTPPNDPKEGQIWIVQDVNSPYYVTSDYSQIGVGYAMEYYNDEWVLRKTYVYNDQKWQLLYYVPIKDGVVDLTDTEINAEIVKEYKYTGEYQKFVAPFNGYYQIELWGAQGGSYNDTYYGGKGAYTKGEIYLNVGETLYIYVGGSGKKSSTTLTKAPGGWNGGGFGIYYNANDVGQSGGGATDIRLLPTSSKERWNEFESLKSRIMVAAGGGGAYYWGTNGTSEYGGSGGTLHGEDGFFGKEHTASLEKYQYAKGGTQTLGGSGVQDVETPARFSFSGGFGYGGNSSDVIGAYQGSGGGGGYYGGGGSSYTGTQQTSAAGGSSYISGYEGCSSIDEISTETNIMHNGNPYHYSGYYFINSKMEPGINSEDGKAKITLINLQQKDNSEITAEKNIFYKYTYEYNGNYQTFTAPINGIYNVDLYGAQGGSYSPTYYGGKGARTTGNIFLSKGDKLYIYVGGEGRASYPKYPTALGGWNGGGFGIYYSANDVGQSGGGATDVRLLPTVSKEIWNEFDSLKSRIMVAGGGGGAYYWGTNGTSEYGGSGGTLHGEDGFYDKTNVATPSFYQYAKGGSQTLGGSGVQDISLLARYSFPGGFGYGGNSSDAVGTYQGSGGGSGYYGGGGSSYTGNQQTSAAGGSSYISGHRGCSSIEESSMQNNIIHNGSVYHYSGYSFENSVMEAGKNTGNGAASIKLVEKIDSDSSKKNSVEYNFYYNGSYQKFIAANKGIYKIELYGAQGGSYNDKYYGGKGGYTKGEIYLEKNETLYVYVGGKGKTSMPVIANIEGGWNGGGKGRYHSGNDVGSSGGGATDIRVTNTSSLTVWNEAESLKSRIMIAAGGGGAYYWGSNGSSEYGGSGGGLTGIDGYYGTAHILSTPTHKVAGGGTQIGGGKGVQSVSTSTTVAKNGGFGYAGDGSLTAQGSGGGSGYYGGGGSTHTGSWQTSAAGGSSYISGHAGCIAVTSAGSPKVQTYSTLNDSVSYTGYKFTNTQMIDGDGYPWTTEKSGTASSQPTQSGSGTQSGNVGDGYAKITYLGA